MKKKLWRKIAIAIAVIILLEAVLRLIGFGKIPVYYASTNYEYAMKPNQDIKRFGNRIYINKEGMRSEELRPQTERILKFGDSVLNGGVATDQSETMSALLEKDLNSELNQHNFQVLNVSAGSWGPDNAYAWMEEHGVFNAKIIILVFSSHDWQDQMAYDDVVGKTPFYPDKNPMLAITDAAYWLYSRMFNTVNWNNLGKVKGGVPNNYDHNIGWDQFLAYAEKNQIPLLIYHHANREECENNEYNVMGRELRDFLLSKNAKVISGLKSGLTADDYRDEIHPLNSGTKKIEHAIREEVLILLSK